MNLNLYHYKGKWLIVDVGLTFENLPGANVAMPKIDLIQSIDPEDIVGVLLTHGHEDHIGALPYLYKFLNKPLYSTPFTSALIKRKMDDHGVNAEIEEVPLGEVRHFGPFVVQWVSVTHSIPDNAMLYIKTECGNIVHTGDWKFDANPRVGEVTAMKRLEEIGKEGVLAVVGDSTNAMNAGKVPSEQDVFDALDKVFARKTKGRIVIVCFSSNVARIDTCARLARKYGRKVALVGRALQRIKEVSYELGYLKDLPTFVSEDEVRKIDRDKMLLICTGSQGELNSGMRRLSEGVHPRVSLDKGDSVLISARAIPGKEQDINDMLDHLARRGINAVTADSVDEILHVSGHPSQEDLKELYTILNPKMIIPVHGSVRHILAHAEVARKLGFKSEVLENGNIMYLGPQKMNVLKDKIDVGQLVLDGTVLIPRDGRTILERTWLESGCIFISIVVDRFGNFKIVTTFSGVCEASDIFKNDVREGLRQCLLKMSTQDKHNQKTLVSTVKKCCRDLCFSKRNKDPSILVHSIISAQKNVNKTV